MASLAAVNEGGELGYACYHLTSSPASCIARTTRQGKGANRIPWIGSAVPRAGGNASSNVPNCNHARYRVATGSTLPGSAKRYRGGTDPLPIRHLLPDRPERASQARQDWIIQQLCGQIRPQLSGSGACNCAQMPQSARNCATRTLPIRYRWSHRPACRVTSKRYREGDYKSAALPTELRRPNVRFHENGPLHHCGPRYQSASRAPSPPTSC